MIIIKNLVQRLRKNYYLAGIFFIVFALFDVFRHGEYGNIAGLAIAGLVGIIFSEHFCVRHNHYRMRSILFLFVLFVTHLFHTAIDAFILFQNYRFEITSVFVLTLVFLVIHELIRIPVIIETLNHEGFSHTKGALIIVLSTGVIYGMFGFGFVFQFPEWVHDMTLYSYMFLAGEILWHERKVFGA